MKGCTTFGEGEAQARAPGSSIYHLHRLFLRGLYVSKNKIVGESVYD